MSERKVDMHTILLRNATKGMTKVFEILGTVCWNGEIVKNIPGIILVST